MTSSSSPSVPRLMKDEEPRNWAELPHELISSILFRLDVDEILLSAQRVCRSWRRACKNPLMWRKIDMRSVRVRFEFRDIEYDSLCRQVVDLSQGGLLEINTSDFRFNDLITYIANRSSNLRSLGIKMFHPMMFKELVNAMEKLPLLETLEISQTRFKLNWKAIGQACPRLQTFKLRFSGYWPPCINDDDDGDDDDDCALAIAGSMPKLRHLQLIGDRLTETGLSAILDNLPYLKHLDLRMCVNIKLVGNLERQCLERIKELRRPHDSTADCPFNVLFFVNSEVDDDKIKLFST